MTPKYTGPASHRWKGGTWLHNGYWHRLVPAHPYRAVTGYVLEHRLIAEAAIGRVLPRTVIVHHANEQRGDNRNSNLVICENRAYHILLHQRMRAYRATGNAAAVFCEYCKEWGQTNIEGMQTLPPRPTGARGASFHRSCRNEYRAKMYAAGKKSRT